MRALSSATASVNVYRTYLQPNTSMDKEHLKIDFNGNPIRGPEVCALVLMEAPDQWVPFGQ
jgi:hypothetical protein